MKSNFKPLLFFLLSVLMVTMVGCSNTKTNTNANTNGTTNGNTAPENNTSASKVNPPTNEEYYTYLTDRYNYYFKDNPLDTTYDIFVDDYVYDNTYDEFITAYNGSYDELKVNLEAFKNDLENNVAKGNTEVDKVNAEVITSVDKAIISVDDYSSTFTEKAKDYATLSKDEVIKGLRGLARAPHDARVELDKLINDAKNTLNIK